MPGRVAQGREDYVGPEARAILAQPPALVFKSALGSGYPELRRGLAALNVFWRVEPGEVLADDLRRPVALDTLRTRIPADHAALRIERDDRVILHAFHDKPEALFALLQ